MKKLPLLFIAALSLANNCFASDELEAGTTDAPNYYILEAGRGTPYLAFNENGLTTQSGVVTNLYRTDNLSEANIWVVTPGSVEGTLTITAYNHTQGLMTFLNATDSEVSYAQNSIAYAGEPTDIYPTRYTDGSISLSINNYVGYESDGNSSWLFYTLDATNNSNFCGNWFPDGAGAYWRAYKLDLTNGVETALHNFQIQQFNDAKAFYLEDLRGYCSNVSWVADELQSGIDAIEKIEFSSDCLVNLTSAYFSALYKAETAMETIFDGREIALKSQRREFIGTSPYVGIISKEKPIVYHETASLIDPTAAYTFKSTGNGGYKLYNEATKTWISTNCDPTTNETSAQVFYTILNGSYGSDHTYYGISLATTESGTGQGLNFQSWPNGSVTFYSVSDEGSIWSLVDISEVNKSENAIASYVAKLEPYIVNVPPVVGDIFKNGIEQIKKLPVDDKFSTEAEKIVDNVMTSANAALQNDCDGQSFKLKCLTFDYYLNISEENGNFLVSDAENAANFVLRECATGGYLLYNEVCNAYLGKPSGQYIYTIPLESEESSAQVFYPFICRGVFYDSGACYGVAFAMQPDIATDGTTMTIKYDGYATIYVDRSTYKNSYNANSVFGLVAAPGSGNVKEIAQNDAIIEVVNGCLIVRNASLGEIIEVYRIDGRRADNAVVRSNETRLSLVNGVNIVKIGTSNVIKVINR